MVLFKLNIYACVSLIKFLLSFTKEQHTKYATLYYENNNKN